MALPDTPLTRSEEYLNNIATGEGTIPDVPYTRIEQYLDYIAKNGGSGGGGGGSGGGGVLLVTDTDGTLDKTMGEIQDAYLAGKRVIISSGVFVKDVTGINPIELGKGEYFGHVETYERTHIDASNVNSKLIYALATYHVAAETEEAARNTYPVHSGS